MLTFHFTVAILAGFASATAVKRAAPGKHFSRSDVQLTDGFPKLMVLRDTLLKMAERPAAPVALRPRESWYSNYSSS